MLNLDRFPSADAAYQGRNGYPTTIEVELEQITIEIAPGWCLGDACDVKLQVYDHGYGDWEIERVMWKSYDSASKRSTKWITLEPPYRKGDDTTLNHKLRAAVIAAIITNGSHKQYIDEQIAAARDSE